MRPKRRSIWTLLTLLRLRLNRPERELDISKLKVLRSDDPDPAVRQRRQELEAKVRAQLEPQVDAMRQAEHITPEILNQVVGPSPEFGSGASLRQKSR
jgi:hypothetical protein